MVFWNKTPTISTYHSNRIRIIRGWNSPALYCLNRFVGSCTYGIWIGVFLCLYTVIGAGWGCTNPDKATNLEGVWGVDSAYTYYNGFSNIILDPSGWATYEYFSDGRLKEIKEGSFLPYTYELSGDTLIHRKTNGELFQVYEVLQLSPSRMVLKKNKAPVFPGKRQMRYEIRYFSKK